MKGIKLIEVRSELGAGTRGASLGIEALKMASLAYGSYLFGKFKSKEVKDSSNLLYKNPIRTYAKRIKGVVKIFQKQANTISKEIKAGRFPVVISGDHSSAGGTIAGIKMANPGKKLGVIWIDAHADLHSPYTTPSGNIHGMPLASALGIDFQGKPKNPVTGDTIPFWDTLKNIGGIYPKITPDSLIFIGLRDTETEETQYIKRNKIKTVNVETIRKGKIKEICKLCIDYLKDCDIIYVSFDIDSLDGSLVKGTGTPVPNGLTVKEATKILTTILKDPKVVCFEITEINPLLDQENRTAIRVFPIFRDAVNAIEKSKKKLIKEQKKIKPIQKILPVIQPKKIIQPMIKRKKKS
jgi:arginase